MYAHFQNFNVCADDAIMRNKEIIASCDHETSTESYLHWQTMTRLLALLDAEVATVEELIEQALTIPVNYERTGSMWIGEDKRHHYNYTDIPDRGRNHHGEPYVLCEVNGTYHLERSGIDCISIYDEAVANGAFDLKHWQDMIRILNEIVKRDDTAEYVSEALIAHYGIEVEEWDEIKEEAYRPSSY